METLNEVLAMATIVSVLYPNDLTPENLATTQAILSAWQAAAKGDRSQAAKFIASEIVAQATKPTTTEAQKALLTTSADSLAHILVGLLPAGKTP
jgi:ABC-type nitrate/sulfonate/bicarbonate transport system permease component